MKIVLIRHGETEGNLEKRYIGKTNETLCKQGIKNLLARREAGYYPEAGKVYISPMKRCQETAELLYPGKPYHIVEELREMDFGIFEGKNYRELSDSKAYREWVEGGCAAKIPSGESRAVFEKRCVRSFCGVLEKEIRKEDKNRQQEEIACAFVIHGGTIMALLHGMAYSQKDYYVYQCGNGEKIVCEVKAEAGEIRLAVCEMKVL